MNSSINKLFEYYDTIFFCEKVELDRFGNMGAHFDGLILDEYLSNSVLGIDYLSIEDYLDIVAGVKYSELENLTSQYSNLDIEKKLNIISAILSLVNFSTFRDDSKEIIIKKSKAFLKRYGLELEDNDNYISIKNEFKIAEGSYCEIYSFNSQSYKKQLKPYFKNDEVWKKRFKYEFENMQKLVESPYVLKVYNYDASNCSYLMEICECNLFEYIEKKDIILDDELISFIKQIVCGMIDVHKNGIIHRDLHLGNILLKDNHIILSDFGLSKDTMVNNSLKSTSTPKNSHFFMDPIGLSDFTKLDKLSDIYSVGKIIDYLTSKSELNQKLSFMLNKATDRDRTKRYTSILDMYNDLESSLREISREEKIHLIEKNILKGVLAPNVEDFIIKLSIQEQLATYIVKNNLNNFYKLLLQLKESNQKIILTHINETYAQATGYGGFENYDLFAVIMYNFICSCNNVALQRTAYNILEGCSSYRYNAKSYLDDINRRYLTLLNN